MCHNLRLAPVSPLGETDVSETHDAGQNGLLADTDPAIGWNGWKMIGKAADKHVCDGNLIGR